MRTVKDIADAAALIAGALDGFDAADAEKAIAAARALRGEPTIAPSFVLFDQPPAYPQPWMQITAAAPSLDDSTVSTFCYPLGVTSTSAGGDY